MIITNETLQALRTMVRGEFAAQMAAPGASPVYKKLATIVPSNTGSNTYGWLGQFPQLREWVGARVVKDIAEGAYAIVNKKYEATLEVKRTDIEDDNLGIYRPLAAHMAFEVERFFNQSVADLMADGFNGLCYDGQPFFDTEHPVYPSPDGTGDPRGVSNILGSPGASGKSWFLVSLAGPLRPFILQQRSAPEVEEITDPKNDAVFMRDVYLYGIRCRGNFGYGLWQQAVASRLDLTPSNYEAARLVMRSFRRDGGAPLGMIPTHLVVDPSNEAAARALLEMQFSSGGGSNPNYHTAELLVVDWTSSNANLKTLTVSAGTLSPAFDPAVTSYAVNVAATVSSITVTGTPAESGAGVSANNGAAQSLATGPNVITITVTAQNGAVKTYTVTVTRAES
ncbi:MAG: Mu-like prophage major head subunit gpT family protein [Treponema sp.]|jgi:phage major head subunit gpT-like protein|nr:Mu-like prophage major head subunit gpT family protein [Treponema sp.]